MHETSFATGDHNHLVVTAAGSVQRSKVAGNSTLSTSPLPTYAQSGVRGVYARGFAQFVLRHDGSVVSLGNGPGVPSVLQPNYASTPPAPARAVALAVGPNNVLTRRADGSVFAWVNDNLTP